MKKHWWWESCTTIFVGKPEWGLTVQRGKETVDVNERMFFPTSMTPLSSQSYTFDPRPNYPLLITAKRYWNPSSPSFSDPNALTLIFTHGTGFHKEQWEPAIDDLYNLLDRRGSATVREIWSIDAPNHGDAAILNEKALTWGYHPICTCWIAV